LPHLPLSAQVTGFAVKNLIRLALIFFLLIAAPVLRAGASGLQSVEVKRWEFPYKGRTFDIAYSRAPDGAGSLDLWMDGGGPGPGSRAQVPYIKSVLDDMQSGGIDPHSLRRIGSHIFLDDLIPLAVACVHSADCRRTMGQDHQKGGIQLSMKILNEEKILSAYQDILTPYGLTFKVCDADSLSSNISKTTS